MTQLKLLLTVIILMGWSCSKDETNNEGTVNLEASGLSDGKLAINNVATFTATLTDYDGAIANLTYRWTLDTEKAELSDGVNTLANSTVAGHTMRCIGRISGDERIHVEVLDENNTIIASASVDFTIIPFVDTPDGLGCFDQPKIIYQYGNSSFYVCNFDGLNAEYLGVGGLSVAISPNGKWIAYNEYDNDRLGYFAYLRNCETNETIEIPGGDGDDYTPEFSYDSKILYFLRPEPSLEENNAGGRPEDIAAYNIETGEDYFLTTLHQSDERVSKFTVSPVSNEIAFIRAGEETQPRLSILNTESGLITDVMTLSFTPNSSMDWSPNGEDIIFSSSNVQSGKGIFRMSLVDGIGPQLIFADLSPQSQAPLNPHYYANGTRIAWSGQENGQNNFNIWSIDVNGNDLQQITNTSGNDTVKGVLE